MLIIVYAALGIVVVTLAACGVPQTQALSASGHSPGESTKETHSESPPPVLFEPDGMAPKPSDAVALWVTSSHEGYAKGPDELLLKVDFAAALTSMKERPPLNIALVLDRSGSMRAEDKFSYTMEAARWVIANMSPRDSLSIIAFNEKPVVLVAASSVVNKTFLFHRLEEVHPEGRTDISAAMLEAVAQIKSNDVPGAVQHILVLTDGNANVGVTDSSGLARIAERAKAQGIGVSSLGLGSDFDEEALTAIAVAGGGRYTYVTSSEQIPKAFQTELHGLLATIAQNVVLRVNVQGAQIVDVSGQILDRPTRRYEYRIGNLRATERGALVLRLAPDRFAKGATVRYQTVLTFDDPNKAERERRVAAGDISFMGRKMFDAQLADETVVIYGGILSALRVAEEAATGRDRKSHADARAMVARWYKRANAHAMKTRNQELLNHAFMLKHFLAELSSMEQEGQMHGHEEARARLRKRGHYQRYLLSHH